MVVNSLVDDIFSLYQNDNIYNSGTFILPGGKTQQGDEFDFSIKKYSYLKILYLIV